MKLRKLLCLVLALLMIAALTACSGGVTGGAPAEDPAPAADGGEEAPAADEGAETPAEAGGFLGCHGNAPFQRIRRFAFSETPLQRRCRPPRPGRSDHRR